MESAETLSRHHAATIRTLSGSRSMPAERERIFDALSRDEIRMMLEADPTWKLPSRSHDSRRRMAEARSWLAGNLAQEWWYRVKNDG